MTELRVRGFEVFVSQERRVRRFALYVANMIKKRSRRRRRRVRSFGAETTRGFAFLTKTPSFRTRARTGTPKTKVRTLVPERVVGFAVLSRYRLAGLGPPRAKLDIP